MKKSLIFSILLILADYVITGEYPKFSGSSNNLYDSKIKLTKPKPKPVASQDYLKLVEFANLAAVAYCVNKGLLKGSLGNQETGCPLSACKNPILKNVEIVKIFDLNNRGEVGTGYFAIDRKRKAIILAFRGTSSRRDWFTDINFIPVKYTPIVYDEDFAKEPYIQTECNGCRVHRGFGHSLRDNSGSIVSAGVKLKDKYPDFRFVILGHSLGAALTVLSGIEFQLLGYDPLVVTFGGPKVGNQEFANFVDNLFDTEEVEKEINEKKNFSRGYIRVVHKHDIVPVLPPSILFAHAGFEYFIENKELPHTEKDLDRRGLDYSNLLTKRSLDFKPSRLWPDQMGKYEHTHYFRKITNCKDEDE